MRLKDKTAVVTGAGSGFGEGIAVRFAEEGASVLVADINEDSAARVAQAISDDGGRAQAFRVDVSDTSQVKAMMDEAESAFGGMDILVNNAGIAQRRGPMLEVTEDEFERIYAVNVKSIYLTAVHGIPLLRKSADGNIVNIASTAAVSPRPGLTWYNGSKGAVVTLTQSMAAELAPEKIRVNAVNPVIGETGLTEAFMGGDTPELREKFVATIPLGRMSTPRDIANASLYLASNEADFITGVAMEVDGGRCI
ncbi:MAG: SDR family oxidoreductase [Rhodospirillales bacterium]|nr:SDR family oxidoreductase [Alphaproteobacteria bacterium]MBL6948619.1 SDR family oxidoreductase [Rhodospirillales bacterium]